VTVLAARLLLLVAVRGVASQQSVDVWITHGLDNVFRDAMPPEGAPSVIGLTTARGETGAAQAALLAVLPSLTGYPRDPRVLLAARQRALRALASPRGRP